MSSAIPTGSTSDAPLTEYVTDGKELRSRSIAPPPPALRAHAPRFTTSRPDHPVFELQCALVRHAHEFLVASAIPSLASLLAATVALVASSAGRTTAPSPRRTHPGTAFSAVTPLPVADVLLPLPTPPRLLLGIASEHM